MDEPVEKCIPRLLKNFGLPADAEFYLDSIAFQVQQAGHDQEHTRAELDHVAGIANVYRNSIEALKRLDKIMPVYLKVKRNPNNTGSLEKLRRAEWDRSERGRNKLEITGLDARIDQYMLGITQPLQ